MQCTDKENIEYVPTSDFEKSNETQNEEFDKFLAEENENLTSKLKLLQQKFELKKQNLVEEEIRNFENKARDSKIKNEKNDSENLISFIDSKKEMKTYNKVKLFKSFSQHHEEKLQGHEDSVKDALEDLERTIKNFNEDFKIILDKQKDLLIMTNNDAINNVMLDFKQLFK